MVRTLDVQTSMRLYTDCVCVEGFEAKWLGEVSVEGARGTPSQWVYSNQLLLPAGVSRATHLAQSSLQPLCSQPLTDRSCQKVGRTLCTCSGRSQCGAMWFVSCVVTVIRHATHSSCPGFLFSPFGCLVSEGFSNFPMEDWNRNL